MNSAITISLTPQARGGPFVFWDDLAAGCAKAADLGFDAVEIFAPAAEALDASVIKPLLERYNLKLAAVGTGAGWVVHKLLLTSPDAGIRTKARQFVSSIIEAGGKLGAPTIIGSMQGRWGQDVSSDAAFEYLNDALNELAVVAAKYEVPVMFEPLNRYETNMVNTLADGVVFLKTLKASNVKLLADLFHMNIEEVSLPQSIQQAGRAIGHVHLADSNRRPAGNGHTDFAAVARALRAVGYAGFVSAECLPWPDPDAAAAKTIESYQRYFAME
jgi:sugar phosphate isomerase/epimerase